MTALDKFREQVRIAQSGATYVVQTAAEAQAVLDEIDGKPPAIAVTMPVPTPIAPADAVTAKAA